MEITYQLTEEDYIQFNIYHAENSSSQKLIFQVARYALPLLMTIPIYFIGTEVFHQSSIYWMVIAALFVLGWILIYPKIFQRSMRKQLEKMLREGDSSSLYGKKTMRIEDDNITVFNEESTEVFAKSMIKDIKVYDDMILLYVSAISAQIVPTRALTVESYQQFMNEISPK